MPIPSLMVLCKPASLRKPPLLRLHQDESVSDDIATDTETLPDELMDIIDGIGFSSEPELDFLDN